MNRREALRVLTRSGVGVVGMGAAGSVLGGCSWFRPPPPAPVPKRHGVTILADGFRADSFQRMLEAGALPNIQRHLVERGTMVETCAGVFPSTTGPAHLPFINGRMPGTNNCPGLRWIDRKRNLVRDYCTLETVLFDGDFPPHAYTLYEMLAGQRTVCIFDFASRGAGEYYRPSLKTMWSSRGDTLESWKRMDQEAVDRFTGVFDEEPLPTFTFVWLPAIDHLSHLHGSLSPEVESQILFVDGQVGRMMEVLQRKGIYDKTLVALVADHGLRDTQRSIDIRRPLERAGFSVLRDLGGNDEFNTLMTYSAARGVSGNGFAVLYFARKKTRRWASWMGWEDKPSFEELQSFPVEGRGAVDLFEHLRGEPAVKLVLALEKDGEDQRSYRVLSGASEARIDRDEFTRALRYSVLRGPDPLGYAQHPASLALMDGAFHDKEVWFAATAATDYPDGVFQIAQLFDAERCGDIVVSSTPGWDFMDQQHRASHGGLERDELLVPCVVAGPGVRAGGTIPRARTVDIYPMFLEFFGLPDLDGGVPHVFLD